VGSEEQNSKTGRLHNYPNEKLERWGIRAGGGAKETPFLGFFWEFNQKVIFPVTLPSQQSLTVVMKVPLNLPLRFGGRVDIVEDFKECRVTNL
jgi:hypothetical protein